MTKKLNKIIIVASLMALLPSCSSTNLNLFGARDQEQSRIPQNATAYDCDEGKIFYVRTLNKGSDAWLIYPDHEVNLTKSSDNNKLYTSGQISLLINGDASTLNDGEKIAYTGCKPRLKK